MHALIAAERGLHEKQRADLQLDPVVPACAARRDGGRPAGREAGVWAYAL
jgi:hypothetical protein